MSDKNDEIVICCPVCGEFVVAAEGGMTIGKQLRFNCHSKKCSGKKRYINTQLLEKIVAKTTTCGIKKRKINAVS